VLILIKELRNVLKKPFGNVYSSLDDLKKSLPKNKPKNSLMISVGDATTKNLLDAGIVPNIGIIDHKIGRKPSKYKIKYRANILYAHNPPGTITDELYKAIEESINLVEKYNSNTLIIVDGEEDLSVLPCILESPNGSLILYGQPDEGVVLVEVDKVKKKAENIIKRFEEVE